VNNTFTIKHAIPSDDAKLKEIIDLSFPMFFRIFASHSVESGEPLLVSELEGLVVGFAKLIEFHVGDDKIGCVLWLAVHPGFRRRGVAAGLVKAGVECLRTRGSKLVFASVQRRNKVSLATFSREGFRRMGFHGLWRLFGFRVFSFYRKIWYAPREIVLMHDGFNRK